MFAILLTGCATTEPVINTVVKYVEVPVSVPCNVPIPQKPDFNFDYLTINDKMYTKTVALLADRHLHIGYEDLLVTALKTCRADFGPVK